MNTVANKAKQAIHDEFQSRIRADGLAESACANRESERRNQSDRRTAAQEGGHPAETAGAEGVSQRPVEAGES